MFIGALYQGIHDVSKDSSGTVYGYEALVRGPQNTHLEKPSGLFCYAQARGIVPDIDMQALYMGCKIFAANDPGGKLFLNIHHETIQSQIFNKETFTSFLSELKLSPCRIVFDIHDQGTDPAILSKKISSFKNVEIGIALDEYKLSLGQHKYLIELRPRYIKVDSSIIRGISRDRIKQEMLKEIINICKDSHAILIAEGVESEDDASYVSDNKAISLVQGYYYSRPVEVTNMLKSYNNHEIARMPC